MRLIVAGREDEALAARIRNLATTLPEAATPFRLSPEHRALRLRMCADPAAFDALSLDLLRHHLALDPRPPAAPRPQGIRARALTILRRALWRLLGAPLERLALQQTRINELLLDALGRVARRDEDPDRTDPAAKP